MTKQFNADCLRTLSDKNYLSTVPAWKLGAALATAAAMGDIVDAFKKKIFYGKDGNLNQLPLSPQEVAEMANLPWNPGAVDIDILHAVMGLFTEAGELVTAVLGAMLGEKPLDHTNLFEEVGDLQWYEALLLHKLDKTHEDAQATVIAKLKARYPEKFTSAAAIERDLDAERQVLEAGFTETPEGTTPATLSIVHVVGEGPLLEEVFSGGADDGDANTRL